MSHLSSLSYVLVNKPSTSLLVLIAGGRVVPSYFSHPPLLSGPTSRNGAFTKECPLGPKSMSFLLSLQGLLRLQDPLKRLLTGTRVLHVTFVKSSSFLSVLVVRLLTLFGSENLHRKTP